MRTKRIYAVLITVFMLIMLFPISTQAVSNPGLDFTLDAGDPAYPGSSGAGWLWDADSKLLTLNGFSYMKVDGNNTPALQLPEDSTIIIAPDSENEITAVDGAGIVTYGSLMIDGSGSLTINSEEHGIRAVGDLSITGLTALQITSQGKGLRVGPGRGDETSADGNLTITDCGDIKIDSADAGMRVSGNLFIDMLDSIEIKTRQSTSSWGWPTGMRIGPGDGTENDADGDAVISNVGKLTIVTNEWGGSGMRVTGNLFLNNLGIVDIASYHTGIRVGPGSQNLTSSEGSLEIIDCTEVNIASSNHSGVRATGNLTVDSVDSLSIESYHTGMRIGSSNSRGTHSKNDAEGYVHIIDSGVDIISTQTGIRSNGAIWTYQSAVEVSDRGDELINYYGLYSTRGGITIERSIVDVAAYTFALVTGDVCGNDYEEPVGGDIVIVQSYVKALVDAEKGIAAIFAGDNLEPEDEGHAEIVITDAYISVPDEAYIVDVDSFTINDLILRCQSITGDSEVVVIYSAEQALNHVEIEPYYFITYDPNGGTGDMLYNEGPYTSGTSIVLMESGFVKEGYLFTGWNTAADGSGTIYLPGQEIPLSDNLTLYAQYEPILYEVTYDANGGAGQVIDENSPYMTGSTVTVMVNIFAKEGYVFTSWNTSADGSGTAYLPGDTFVIEADITLFAQYAEDIPEVEPEDDDIDIDEDEDVDVDEDEQEKEPIPKTGDTGSLHGRVGIVLLLAGLLIAKKRSVTNG